MSEERFKEYNELEKQCKEDEEVCPICLTIVHEDKMVSIGDDYQHLFKGECRVCINCEETTDEETPGE